MEIQELASEPWVDPESDTSPAQAYLGAEWYFIEEWSQFVGKCNWYTFTPIKIEIEDDRILGGWEFTLVILGVGFRFRYNYAETELVLRLRNQIKEINDEERFRRSEGL